jgi:hypothetical protein
MIRAAIMATGHDAVPGLGDPLHRHQFRHHREGPVDRDRKPDALGTGSHRHVHANHLAGDVEQRAAGVAGIDRGVGLDEVVVPLRAAHLDVAVKGRDDAPGHGVFVAEGVAEGEHRLADHQIAGCADADHRQRLVDVDLEHGQVGAGIVRHQLACDGLARGERHLDPADALHHVVVGDDVASVVDDHAGAHAVDTAEIGGRLVVVADDEFLAVDVDHAVAGRLDRPHDRGPAQLPRVGRRCRPGRDHGQGGCPDQDDAPDGPHTHHAPARHLCRGSGPHACKAPPPTSR